MNERQLTFSGLKAFSWLAQHSYRIGFDMARAYPQDNGLEIHKTDQTSGYITARTATAMQDMMRLRDEWKNDHPAGIIMGDII